MPPVTNVQTKALPTPREPAVPGPHTLAAPSASSPLAGAPLAPQPRVRPPTPRAPASDPRLPLPRPRRLELPLRASMLALLVLLLVRRR